MTNRPIRDLHGVNSYLKPRGPDATSFLETEGISCIHNLLSITGAVTTQPIVQDCVLAMHNGEIYNYGSYSSDAHCLIPNYQRRGNLFAQHLDGEFAILIADFKKQQVIASVDPFRTKPLWYAIENGTWGFSTYRTPLERLGFSTVSKVPANSIWRLDLVSLKFEQLAPTVVWDLRQHTDHFFHWCTAFEQSIAKRTKNLREQVFLGLSSGYDSGAIACELERQGVAYRAISVLGKENMDVLNRRARAAHQWIEPHQSVRDRAHNWLLTHVESYNYTISSSSSSYNEFDLLLHNDSGSNGLSMVCERARSLGARIMLSGQGSDEIFSDYGFGGQKIYAHSNFGGQFPEDLSSIFPWNSFYGSSMESYLAKEEYVAGSYGIEARYPFLDRQVVQQFLWLTPRLKNSFYKAPLHHYLTTHNYPFAPNQKIGF